MMQLRDDNHEGPSRRRSSSLRLKRTSGIFRRRFKHLLNISSSLLVLALLLPAGSSYVRSTTRFFSSLSKATTLSSTAATTRKNKSPLTATVSARFEFHREMSSLDSQNNARGMSLHESRLDQSGLQMTNHLQQGDFQSAYTVLSDMFQLIQNSNCSQQTNKEGRRRLSSRVDTAVQTFTNVAFETVASGQQDQRPDFVVMLAVDAIQMQLSSRRTLMPPYNLVPKRTFLCALKALTSIEDNAQQEGFFNNRPQQQQKGNACDSSSADAAFRMLQRLVTGVGVRRIPNKPLFIAEQDFNLVLNAYANAGRMDMAQRVVALQERTPHAPPLSAVSYSILLKGFGRLGDLEQVGRVLKRATEQGRRNNNKKIEPDIVMANSLLDAYVNCNALEKALGTFRFMSSLPREGGSGELSLLLAFKSFPRPSARTYNIILKGLANAGLIQEALQVSSEMDGLGFWDCVTTNTLVHAAVVAGDLTLAERILEDHHHLGILNSKSSTSGMRKERQQQRNNVEAYTELIDAYTKASQLPKAVAVFQTMRDRGVEPNEITFTCLIAGFGRNKQVEQARKTIQYMSSRMGIRPSCVTYNALISGIVSSSSSIVSGKAADATDPRLPLKVCSYEDVDEALGLFRDMIQSGIRPNAVTASTLVYALGHCTTPRVKEAKLLVEKLERDNMIPAGNAKVMTSLVQTCGMGGDAVGAVEAFRSLKRPDLVAVNAFLEVCCRCGRYRLALDTFDYYFRGEAASELKLKPDVISYSVLVSSFLKRANSDSIRRVQSLYSEMKGKSLVFPDTVLIDIILKAFVRIGRSRRLSKEEAYFVLGVQRDAERLRWAEGQLERRKRAVGAIVGSKFRDFWLSSDNESDGEDELFKRKGWNKVDSGFRLLGSGSESSEPSKKVVDRFLESKGWNDIDSGFRII